jgi:glycolate oxidase FAD binding subunit
LATDDPVLATFAAEVGDSGPVTVVGSRSRWDIGGPLDPAARELSAPTGIVDYAPEEMTVTVRAGTSVAELHAELASKGQRSALVERHGPDGPGTVGGALAVGENDVRALGRGMLRTSLLQIRYVSAEGRLVSSGGPTVKNVSGFDLPRLMVGSLGTLGLLAEAIIRTNPIPPVSRWLRSDRCDPFAVRRRLLAPGAVLWDGQTTWVQIEGHGPDVDEQQRALAPEGTFTEVGVEGDRLPVELPPHRWSLAPDALAGLAAPGGDGDRGPGRFVAAVGLGLVFGEQPQPLRAMTPEVEELNRRVKQNFDPNQRLNPGRNPGRK